MRGEKGERAVLRGLYAREKKRTVAARGSLVVEVVAHDGGGLVEEPGDFGVFLIFEELG